MTRARFNVSFCAFLLGIFARSILSVPVPAEIFLMLLSCIPVAVLRRFRGSEPHILDGWFWLIFLALIFASLGMLRYDLSELKRYNPELSAAAAGERAELTGSVASDPVFEGASVSFTLSVDAVDHAGPDDGSAEPAKSAGRAVPARGSVLVQSTPYAEIGYGDEVRVSGALAPPENFKEEDGREFDYVSYLAKDGIYYVMKRPSLRVIAPAKWNLHRALFGLRRIFIAKINSLFSDPHSALLVGLLIGAKQSLGKNLEDEFRRVGLIHVVVLSGSNVTIVANAFASVLGNLPRALAISGSAIGVILFTVMTGGTATVVRATLMALIALLGKFLGRDYDPMRGLLIACFLMLLGNPKLLVFDPSFQLSFLSTLGLMLFAPHFERWLKFLPERFSIREIAVVTCSTQAFVTPFTLYLVGQISVVALVVNFLVIGFVPATMLIGFIAVACGFVSGWLAYPAALAAYALLSYELAVTHFFSALPFAAAKISFPLWLMAASYVPIGIFLWRKRAVLKE